MVDDVTPLEHFVSGIREQEAAARDFTVTPDPRREVETDLIALVPELGISGLVQYSRSDNRWTLRFRAPEGILVQLNDDRPGYVGNMVFPKETIQQRCEALGLELESESEEATGQEKVSEFELVFRGPIPGD